MTAGDIIPEGRRGGITFSLAISVVAITLVTRAGSVKAADDPADLTYLSAHHAFTGSTQYTFVNATGDVTNAVSPSYSFRLHTQVISQSLSYGFTDALRLSFGLVHDHVDSSYDVASASGSSQKSTSAGLADLSLTYRLLQQSTQPFNLDLSVGNNGAGTAVSYESGDFAILGRAGVFRSRGGMGFDPVRDVELTTHQTWGYEAELRTQFKLSRRWSLNLGAAYTSAPFSGSTNASIGDSSFQIKRPDFVSVGLAAIYHIVPDRLSVRLGYDHSFIGQRRDEYADSTRDVVASNQRADAFGLALIYRF